MKSTFVQFARCCNPYSVKGHRKNNSAELRPVTPALKLLHPDLSLNQLICGTCRLKIQKNSEDSKVQDIELDNDEGSTANELNYGETNEPATSSQQNQESASTRSQESVDKLIEESIAKSSQQSHYVLTGESMSSLSLTENLTAAESELSDTDVAIQQINGVLNSLNLPLLKTISHLTDSYILAVVNDVHQTLRSKLEIIRRSNRPSNPGDISSNMVKKTFLYFK